MNANAHQIVLLARSWVNLPINSKIALHSFVTGGHNTNFGQNEMLHSIVKELRSMSGKYFEDFALMLHEFILINSDVSSKSAPDHDTPDHIENYDKEKYEDGISDDEFSEGY